MRFIESSLAFLQWFNVMIIFTEIQIAMLLLLLAVLFLLSGEVIPLSITRLWRVLAKSEHYLQNCYAVINAALRLMLLVCCQHRRRK